MKTLETEHYIWRHIDDDRYIPGGVISKMRLNGVGVRTKHPDRATGVIVFDSDAHLEPEFWPHVNEWCDSGFGSQHCPVTVARFFRGSFDTKFSRFNEESKGMEIIGPIGAELREVADAIGCELEQPALLLKDFSSGWILVGERVVSLDAPNAAANMMSRNSLLRALRRLLPRRAGTDLSRPTEP